MQNWLCIFEPEDDDDRTYHVITSHTETYAWIIAEAIGKRIGQICVSIEDLEED